MHDTGGVRRFQAAQDLTRPTKGGLQGNRTLAQTRQKGFAVDQRHRQKDVAFTLLDVEDGADVRVAQLGRQPGFVHEAPAVVFVGGRMGQKLQRHHAAQAQVLCFEHLAHAPFAEGADDPVTRDDLARRHELSLGAKLARVFTRTLPCSSQPKTARCTGRSAAVGGSGK